MKCANCGAQILNGAIFCGYCGTQVGQAYQPRQTQQSNQSYQAYNQAFNQAYQAGPQQPPQVVVNVVQPPVQPGVQHVVYRDLPSPKSRVVALVLCAFLGPIGGHRFYLGKAGSGLLYLFTGGLFGIGWVVDLLSLLLGHPMDAQGPRLTWEG